MDSQEKKPKPRSKNAEYVARFRERQRELGRKKREMYLTDYEAEQLGIFLKKIRSKGRFLGKPGYEDLTDDDL